LKEAGIEKADALATCVSRFRNIGILGISGMVGSGRTEVARAIMGIDPKDAGEILLEGKKKDIKTPVDAIQAGITLIPENRKEQGLVLVNSVRFNITLAILREFIRFVRSYRKKEERIVADSIRVLNIRTPHFEQLLSNLSGGNQQKIVIARELSKQPEFIIIAQPTRGVDIGAIEFIHKKIIELRDSGVAILLISAELSEIINLSDRIGVIYNGELLEVMNAADASEEKLGLLMVGISKNKTDGGKVSDKNA